jgi:maltooligosyltrehalose trehalohydrolase
MPVAQETIGPQSFSRRLPVGAEILPEGGVHFRVWAPDRKKVEVFLEQEDQSSEREKICCELQSEQSGYFSTRCGTMTFTTAQWSL